MATSGSRTIATDSVNTQVDRPPIPAVMAALVAYAALAFTGDGYLVLSSLGLLLVATHVWDARLTKGSWASWMVRVVLFTIVVAANVVNPVRVGAHGLYDAGFVHAFGQLLAAELVVQCWRQRPTGGSGGAVIVLLSGIIFLAACNTPDHRNLKYFTPAYMLFLVLAIRGLPYQALNAKNRLRRSVGGWAGACMLLGALAFGAVTSFVLKKNQADLEQMVQDLDLRFLIRQSVGFTDSPSLGATQGVQRSMARVLRLDGSCRSPYLHGVAFEKYEKGRWKPSLSGRVMRKVAATEFEAKRTGTICLITRLTDNVDLLFMPLHSAGFVPSRGKEVEQGTEDAGLVRLAAPAPFSYSVVSDMSVEHQGPLCRPIDDAQRSRCLDVPPEIDPRVKALARKIAGNIEKPRDRVSAVEKYLHANHDYSLATNPGRGDPISNFLLEKKAAHCEFFASAACMLLRSVGVPTRFVSGFYAHEPLGPETIIVRQQDAHAWAESWVDGKGWVTVDGTPPGHGRPDTTSDKPPFWRSAWEWINETALAIGDWFYERSWTELGLIFGGAFAVIISLLWLREILMRRKRRGASAEFAYLSPGEALDAIRQRFDQLLTRRGIPCPDNLPWSEHLMAVAAGERAGRIRIDFEEADAFARAYRTVRFGKPDSREAVAELDKQLQALERRAK